MDVDDLVARLMPFHAAPGYQFEPHEILLATHILVETMCGIVGIAPQGSPFDQELAASWFEALLPAVERKLTA